MQTRLPGSFPCHDDDGCVCVTDWVSLCGEKATLPPPPPLDESPPKVLCNLHAKHSPNLHKVNWQVQHQVKIGASYALLLITMKKKVPKNYIKLIIQT